MIRLTPTQRSWFVACATLSLSAAFELPSHAHSPPPSREHVEPSEQEKQTEPTESPSALRPRGVEIVTLSDLYTRFDAHPRWRARVDTQSAVLEAQRRGARTFEDPNISYDFAAHVHGEDFVDGSQHALTIEWEAPLRRVRGGRAREVARALELLEAELRGEREEYFAELRSAWASAQSTQAQLKALNELYEEIDGLAHVLRDQVALGVVAPYELQRLELRLTQLRAERRRIEDALLLDGMWLGGLVGDAERALLPHPDAPPSTENLRALVEASEYDPVIAADRARTALARERARVARLERTPTLVLHAGPQFATRDFGVAALGGVQMRLPLSARQRRAVERADAEAAAAHASEAWTTHLAQVEREALLRKWDEIRDALAYFDAELAPRLQETLALARQSYLGELIGFAELLESLDAKLELALERVELLQELSAAESALLRWVDPALLRPE